MQKTDVCQARLFVIVIFLSGFLLTASSYAQLAPVFDNTLTPEQMVRDVLLGAGVEVTNIKYTGSDQARGTFDDSGTLVPTLDFAKGIILTSGSVFNAPGPNLGPSTTAANGEPGDPDLNFLLGNNMSTDASVLEFDFVPVTDIVEFRYIFASEEYPEYAGSQFNDIFAFLVSGPGIIGKKNIALIPNTNTIVSINNVNATTNPVYYRDNSLSIVMVEYDGLTTVFTATVKVVPCKKYHIKLAVSDVGDQAYDTSVLLEAGSFISANSVYLSGTFLSPDSTVIEGCEEATINVNRLTSLEKNVTIHYDIGGIAVDGTDYLHQTDSVVFVPGQATASITFKPIADGVTESPELVYVKFKDDFVTCLTDSVAFKIKDPPAMSSQISNDTAMCLGESALLNVIATGGIGAYTYQWSTGDHTQSISVTPSATTTYTVTVFDSCGGLSTMASTLVTVLDPPVADGGPDVMICQGSSAQLTASGGIVYAWSPSTGLSDSSVADPVAAPSATTVYTVTVTNSNGCTASDPVTITVTEPLQLSITPAMTITKGEETQLEAFASGGSGSYSYTWDPPIGTGPGPHTVKPDSNTLYRVFVTDQNPNACPDINDSTWVLIVIPESDTSYFHLPNAFSPNGDGVNDVFKPIGYHIEQYNLKIYNRWGEMLFETKNLEDAWNGIHNGLKVPPGAYIYMVTARESTGKTKALTGTVSLTE